MLDPFEQKLFDSLDRLVNLRSVKSLGVAVSGGADSISLLYGLSCIKKTFDSNKKKFPKILCVTVDHSIRPEAESSGDAAFVQALCNKLGILCSVKKIERGLVESLSLERGKGIEEAARFLRYKKFEEFAEESGAQFICLAHNQNDALETLLMRFLQGSSASYGIAPKRDIYLRPLLDCGRPLIEEYLRKKKIDWRTDSTNSENSYLRNKVRNLLIPFLEENFDGWKKALLSGGEKARFENDALELFYEKAVKKNSKIKVADGVVEITKDAFEPLPIALRQRYLYKAFSALSLEDRIPYSFVRTMAMWPEKNFKKIAAAGLEASSKKDKVFLKILKKEATESGFFAIIVGKDSADEAYLERTRAVGDRL